jgi:hypothetical protein
MEVMGPRRRKVVSGEEAEGVATVEPEAMVETAEREAMAIASINSRWERSRLRPVQPAWRALGVMAATVDAAAPVD